MAALRSKESPSAPALYAKAFKDFQKQLELNPKLTLFSYCLSHHIYRPGFQEWITGQGYDVETMRSIAKSKASSNKPTAVPDEKHLEPQTSPLEPVGFVQFKPSYKRATDNLLSNICIQMPNGISITLQSASLEEITDIVNRCNYKMSLEV